MRDNNPMPALSQLRRVAETKLVEHGLALDGFLVLPSDTDDGTSVVHLVVSLDRETDLTPAHEFEAIVAHIPPDVLEAQADKARQDLEDLRDRLKDRDKGIL